MASGTVKWYKKSTGYGIIVPDDGGEEIFVHYSRISHKDLHFLTENQPVTFDVKVGPMGPVAINVRV